MAHLAAVVLFAVALGFADASLAGDEHPLYNLAVSFDVAKAKITGSASVEARPGAELTITRGDLRILSLRNGRRRIVPNARASDPFTLLAEGPVEIRYEGIFKGTDVDVIDRDKILLRNIWYPVIAGTYRYHFKASVPHGFVALSEGDYARRTETKGKATFSFDLPYPQRDWDGITFAASRQWVSRAAMYRDIPLSVYLLRRNAARLDDTVRQAQRYLQQLEALLGPYPFKRLVIAENPVPIGYSLSMPTYILLAQESVAANTAEDSSLNHEIAHAWFGKGVLADYAGGNWAEGLASYFSDQLENERLGRGWQRRQRMMGANQSFVADRAESPLSDFSESNDRPSKIIGYAKAALVVHMLRRLVGDEQFFAAIRSFVAEYMYRPASWADMRKTFERETASDLGWFFHQWVDGPATPELGLANVSAKAAGGRYGLSFTVTQRPPAFALAVPLTIYLEGGGSETKMLQVLRERNEFDYSLKEKPVRIVLDESYDVIRRLTPPEVPPMISTLLARPRVTLIGTPAEQVKFSSLTDAFVNEGMTIALHGEHQEWTRREPAVKPAAAGAGQRAAQRVIARSTASTAAIASLPTSLILLGEHEPLISALFGHVELPHVGFSITVLKHPRSPGDMIAILAATSKAEVDAAYDSLITSPRYSMASFNAGEMADYELTNGERGIAGKVVIETH